jgi:hypothetical protein
MTRATSLREQAAGAIRLVWLLDEPTAEDEADAVLAVVREALRTLPRQKRVAYNPGVGRVETVDLNQVLALLGDMPYDAWLAGQGIDPDTGEC